MCARRPDVAGSQKPMAAMSAFDGNRIVVLTWGATPSNPGTVGTSGSTSGRGAASRHIDPDIALHFPARIGAQAEFARRGLVALGQSRDFGADAIGGAERPPMVAAAKMRSVKAAMPHGHAAMGAGVAIGKDRPGRRAPEQQFLAEDRCSPGVAWGDAAARDRKVPKAHASWRDRQEAASTQDPRKELPPESCGQRRQG